MLKVASVVLAVGVLGACSSRVVTPSSQSAESGQRTVYVSVTEKNTVTKYLNRLTGQGRHLVVTSTPVENALESRALVLNGIERMMLVELQGAEAVLPGEQFRMGGFAVVNMPLARDPHLAFGSTQLYAEDIGEREIDVSNVPAPRPLALPAASDFEQSPVSVDQAFLELKERELSGEVPVTVGAETFTIAERQSDAGRTHARALLRREYEGLGFTVTEERYTSGGRAGVNFVAEKAGTDTSRVVMVTSHIDSVGNAGADDNGAGTIAALAISKALRDETLRYTLRVVAFDQEELGLVGSAEYARSHNAAGNLSQVIGVFNLEMIGYDSDDDGAFHSIDCDENTSADLTAMITQVVARDPLRLQLVDACTNRSDHASFWRYNIPAIVFAQNFFGGDSNPCYHRTCDKVDQMNFNYMTRMTNAAGRGIASLVVEPRS